MQCRQSVVRPSRSLSQAKRVAPNPTLYSLLVLAAYNDSVSEVAHCRVWLVSWELPTLSHGQLALSLRLSHSPRTLAVSSLPSHTLHLHLLLHTSTSLTRGCNTSAPPVFCASPTFDIPASRTRRAPQTTYTARSRSSNSGIQASALIQSPSKRTRCCSPQLADDAWAGASIPPLKGTPKKQTRRSACLPTASVRRRPSAPTAATRPSTTSTTTIRTFPTPTCAGASLCLKSIRFHLAYTVCHLCPVRRSADARTQAQTANRIDLD